MKLALALTLAAFPAMAGPTDPGTCGRFDAFRAAIQAEGFIRWPGYLFATVDGAQRRAEVWYHAARAETRVAAVDQVGGKVTNASKTCVTVYSDPGVSIWRVE